VSKRSYQQFCGLAVALDVVAERWALLIVRDLTPGPRRFTDISAGLPGVASDVLADRLRGLEASGAVELIEIKYPAPAKVYQLTERGHELSEIALRLAKWGSPLLPQSITASANGYKFNARWVLQTMANEYAGGLPSGEYLWTIDEADYSMTIGETNDGVDQAHINYGPPSQEPLQHVSCSTQDFLLLIRHYKKGRAFPKGVRHEGDRDLLDLLFTRMPIPG
jgi:DNA-binding HxlR family transcriptional regulator